jgi:hypothetical protein
LSCLVFVLLGLPRLEKTKNVLFIRLVVADTGPRGWWLPNWDEIRSRARLQQHSLVTANDYADVISFPSHPPWATPAANCPQSNWQTFKEIHTVSLCIAFLLHHLEHHI